MMTKKRNVSLDVLRITAMLMVLFVHIPIYIPLPYSFPNGQYGVAVFFVLSGYLIMESLDKETSAVRFYKRRLIRILPEYYMILLVGVIVWDLLLGKMPADSLLHLGWIRYFLCLNTVLPSNDYFYWNDLWGLWTISCFMFFYLIAPLVRRAIHSFAGALCGLGAFFFLGYAWKAVLQRILVMMQMENAEMFAGDTPLFNLMVFMLGVCAWYAVREQKEQVYMIFCVLVVACFVFTGKTNRLEWGALAAIAILAGTNIEVSKSRVWSGVRILSEYSFTIYLVHFPVFQILDAVMGQDRNPAVFAAASVTGIVGMSIVVHGAAGKMTTCMLSKNRSS
jgi:peptidoglycan/LPS O-acetylase OafA/YrhL